MTDKKDWANISDDEDESSEESPEPSPLNQPTEQQAEPVVQPEPQQVEGQIVEKQEQPRVHHDQRPKRSDDEKKGEFIREIEALAGPKVYLNLHGLNPNVKAENIREFYQPITIGSVIASQTKEGLYDLEFTSKDDAIKAVEKGTGELGKSKFCLRMSHRNYPKDSGKPYDKRGGGDRGNKNYGQKGQGNRGGYDNKNKYQERDDYYYNKNQEGGQRGGYDKKNRDQGSWKQGGGQQPHYQVRTNEERKNEEQRPRQEEQQFANQPKRQESDKWEKGLQLPDEPRRHDYKKKDDYQRRDDNRGDYKEKFGMKKYNSDYTTEGGNYGYSNRGQDYRNNEDKSDTIEKGRGAKKYNQDEPLEQDKILQMKDRQSSYKSQGSDKGYHKKDYNKGYDKGYGGGYGGGDNYNKSRYYDDQKNYKPRQYKDKDEYYQGKGGEEAVQRVYTKKPSDSATGQGNQAPTGSTPTNQGAPELTKKPSFSQGSKNTANPFTILENENGKK